MGGYWGGWFMNGGSQQVGSYNIILLPVQIILN